MLIYFRLASDSLGFGSPSPYRQDATLETSESGCSSVEVPPHLSYVKQLVDRGVGDFGNLCRIAVQLTREQEHKEVPTMLPQYWHDPADPDSTGPEGLEELEYGKLLIDHDIDDDSDLRTVTAAKLSEN